ncbi:MAG: cytidylate kinase-like family protein [Ruminococcaceae bacterium]|nr:cytidylate kinase-like family protein [Oscillospiraceae bacterium]
MANCVITIARGFGSGGRTIGKLLAQKLDIDYYNDDLIKLASEESGINLELFGKADERVKTNLFKKYKRSYGEWTIPPDSDMFVSDDNLFNYQAKIIRQLADKGSCVIIGRCADYILKGREGVARILVYADEQTCISRVTELYGMKKNEAIKKIETLDKARANYYKYYTGKDWTDVDNYDLCLNTSGISFDKAVDIIVDYLKQMELVEKE